jgi:hypothetical protein
MLRLETMYGTVERAQGALIRTVVDVRYPSPRPSPRPAEQERADELADVRVYVDT